MEIQLLGKRTLVTGANSGIGKAIALALAAAGSDVALNYVVNPQAAQEIAERIQGQGVRALQLKADVSDPQAVSAMFAKVEQSWGGVDLLVNNAGIDGKRALSWEVDLAAWRKVLEVNLFGAFYCAREALKGMVTRKSGVVLNISSVHERIPWHGYSAYATAKAGLSMLTKTLAQEAASHGVRVLALAPGAVKTPISQSVWSDPQALSDLLTKIPYGRMGDPDEIARMVVTLLSDAASYVTGTTVFVDGGMTLYPSFEHGG
ncbi:MAG TPA: SDR family oxidoreductase [Candidatus Fraserbacteria bacterium]|nr:SDR family oxidoreductase [Candidatus Fraserbacteria bacterium]